MVSESQIEKEFTRWVAQQGGLCLKQNPNWVRGIPDRLVILPGGRCYFIEFKKPGGTIRKLQARRKRQLRRKAIPAYFVRTVARAKRLYKHHQQQGCGCTSKAVTEAHR